MALGQGPLLVIFSILARFYYRHKNVFLQPDLALCGDHAYSLKIAS